MLSQLRSLNVDRLDIDDAVALLAFATGLRQAYEAAGVKMPEWVSQNTRLLKNEIRSRQQDDVAKRLKEAKARFNALKPAEQRRTELQDEITRLEALATVDD